ncbi:MAG: DUF523 domain-containing protein [Candidatus Omnitrophota bacterium]
MSKKIFVSRCLIGYKCAYDGGARYADPVKRLCDKFGYAGLCPEMAGGLGCPREAHEIVDGSGEDVLDGKARVVSFSGEDHTGQFLRGARAALETVLKNDISIAIMRSRSPSCGKGKIHSGKFNGVLREGNGVTAALFLRSGISVFTENDSTTVRQILETSRT